MKKELPRSDTSTHDHSTNVAVVSIGLGMALGYTQDTLVELGTGGLLHDIGKSKLDERLWNNPGIFIYESDKLILTFEIIAMIICLGLASFAFIQFFRKKWLD